MLKKTSVFFCFYNLSAILQKKVSFIRSFSKKNKTLLSVNTSRVEFFSAFFNYLKQNFLFRIQADALMLDKFTFNRDFALILKHRLVNTLHCFSHTKYKNNLINKNYKFWVNIFHKKSNFFLLQPVNMVGVMISVLITYLIKITYFVSAVSLKGSISALLLLLQNIFTFSFVKAVYYFYIFSGLFITYSNKIVSFSAYLVSVFPSKQFKYHNFNWHLLRSNLLVEMLNNSNLLKAAKVTTQLKFLTYLSKINLESTEKHFGFDSKNALQFKFFFSKLWSLKQLSQLVTQTKISNLLFSIPFLSRQFNSMLSEKINFVSFNLFRVYSNFTFFKPYTNLYSKFFEFYLLKLVGILTRRGLFLKAYSIVNYFFFRLHCLNANTTAFFYFSDPFINILPQLQLTQRFFGRNNHRSVTVPRLLHLQKRIPKILRVFLKNVYTRNEHGFTNCFYFEYLALLESKAGTFKAITETYKQSIINLQFIQSMKTSFVFDFKTRINPSSINTRKRTRLRDDLYFF